MRRIVVSLILVAFALRALVPAGYMFAPAESGQGLTVVICTAQGSQHVTIDVPGDPLKQPAGDRSDELCDYGTLPIALHSDEPQAEIALQLFEDIEHARLAAFLLSARLKVARYARGPPSHVSI